MITLSNPGDVAIAEGAPIFCSRSVTLIGGRTPAIRLNAVPILRAPC
jgi:hypothetical protein